MFDIGQVIVPVYPRRAAETLARDAGRTPEEILAVVERDPLFREFQRGRIPPAAWHAHLSQALGFELSFEEFVAAWNRTLGEQTLLSDELFTELGRGRRLVLLSNTDPIHVAHIENRFRFPHLFAARIYSCTAGKIKPDPALYAEAIEAAEAPPEEILYVDDVPEFVEAGQRAGMQVYRFRGAEELLGELRDRGLVV